MLVPGTRRWHRRPMTGSRPLPLSVFIIARNEAARIVPTIRAIRDLTDDLVVVDSGSTDGTRDLAAELGARVIEHAWPGYGPQKRFAEEQCRHRWILNIDADEVVTPALSVEIPRSSLWASRLATATKSASRRSFPGNARRTLLPTRSPP